MPINPTPGSLSPVPHEPLVPLGATLDPEKQKIDDSGTRTVPTKDLGPEFPLTPAARSHTVTDEQIPGTPVIDHGPKRLSQAEIPAARKSGRLSRESSTR